MIDLNTPFGSFRLYRFPRRRRETLRAWDAADELLLEELAAGPAPAPGETLILNDSFGALGCALAPWQPWWQSDSALAHEGLLANLRSNGISPDQIRRLDSLTPPEGPIRLLVLRLPKMLALLEHQLRALRPLLTADARLIATGMVKNMSPGHFRLIEEIIGPTRTSLARRKARLIFAAPDPAIRAAPSPYPTRYRLEGTDLWLSNHAGLFSREKLDMGTRIMLGALPRKENCRDILDLACGNGVIGIMAARLNPQARIWFRDESLMAVASARENFAAAFGESREADFGATDCAADMAAESVDLVLNNPPFHQQHAVGDEVARRMFRHAHRVLRRGGELWVIGNRHLGYHIALKRQFGNCRVVTSDRKFVLLAARKD